MEQTSKREPSYLEVAEQLISALRQQESRTSTLEKEFAAQKSLNANLEARIQRLEKEKKDLESVLTQQKTKAEEKTRTAEQASSPEQGDSLEDALRAMYGYRHYSSPDALFWLLKRGW